MPFRDGTGSVKLEGSELRVTSVTEDGVQIEIRPYQGPIGGISIFVGRDSMARLHQAITDALALMADKSSQADHTREPPSSSEPAAQNEALPTDSAAEIWLRGHAEPPTSVEPQDVLEAPSFWSRWRR